MNAWKALILNQSSKRVDHLHGSSYLVRFEHLFYVWSIIYHQFSFLALKTNKSGSHACAPIHFSRFASLLLPPFHTCPLCHRTLAHPHSWLLCDQQAADIIRVTGFHSNTAQSSQWPRCWQPSEEGRLRRLPSEAGPHVRLCRFAAGLDEPTLIYGEALPCHPPYTHINPSYSIWLRDERNSDEMLLCLIWFVRLSHFLLEVKPVGVGNTSDSYS